MNQSIRRIVLLGSSLLIGCADTGDSPLAPHAGTQAPSAATYMQVDVVQRINPLPASISASAEIGGEGGVIAIPQAGVRVIFPRSAVNLPADQESVRITVTAVQGSSVAYIFEPHGTTFRVPVRIEQDAKLTEAFTSPSHQAFRGAYFPDESYLSAKGSAKIGEFRPTHHDRKSAKLRWTVEHFSGYLLASS